MEVEVAEVPVLVLPRERAGAPEPVQVATHQRRRARRRGERPLRLRREAERAALQLRGRPLLGLERAGAGIVRVRLVTEIPLGRRRKTGTSPPLGRWEAPWGCGGG